MPCTIVPASDLRLVLTTAGSRDEAERIAHALVEQRFAACVNLVPGLTSVFRWQGQIESANEILLIIKTTAGNLEQVEPALRALHSYQVPEFLVLTPDSVAQPWLAWLMDSVLP